MPSFTLKMEGFDKAISDYGAQHEAKLVEAARMAINDTTKWALTHVRKDMYSHVRFPSGYLEQGDRLKIGRMASNNLLEATINSRFEPTSLARFALDAGSKNGIMVSVKVGGSPKRIKKGFIWGLKRGDVRRGNVGLVVRSEGKPEGAYKPKEVGDKWPNLWLLYGPSVYQVFRESMDRYAPEVTEYLNDRFEHHRNRLMGQS